MNATRDRAIILRTSPYGEADRIVVLFCREHGQVRALGRGARKSQRRFAAGLPPYAEGEASFVRRAASGLGLLEEFSLPRGGPTLELAPLAHAAYVCELVELLSAPEAPETAVYDLLAATLAAIAEAGADPWRLRAFELGLLDRLGFGPAGDRCAACEQELGASDAAGWSGRGLACAACAESTHPHLVAACATLRRGEAPRGAAPLVVRQMLAAWLAGPLDGRPLRSVEFIDKLNRGLGT